MYSLIAEQIEIESRVAQTFMMDNMDTLLNTTTNNNAYVDAEASGGIPHLSSDSDDAEFELSPQIKDELRTTIQNKRLKNGQEELVVEDLPKKTYEVGSLCSFFDRLLISHTLISVLLAARSIKPQLVEIVQMPRYRCRTPSHEPHRPNSAYGCVVPHLTIFSGFRLPGILSCVKLL